MINEQNPNLQLFFNPNEIAFFKGLDKAFSIGDDMAIAQAERAVSSKLIELRRNFSKIFDTAHSIDVGLVFLLDRKIKEGSSGQERELQQRLHANIFRKKRSSEELPSQGVSNLIFDLIEDVEIVYGNFGDEATEYGMQLVLKKGLDQEQLKKLSLQLGNSHFILVDAYEFLDKLGKDKAKQLDCDYTLDLVFHFRGIRFKENGVVRSGPFSVDSGRTKNTSND